MMPWEHVIVGYIGYSLLVHGVYRRSPTSKETLVVAGTSLLPDIVDKPLAWEFGVFTSGYGIAHSVFLAIPASLAIGWLTWHRGQRRLGWAFAAGCLLHLVGDLGVSSLAGGETQFARVLWPVRSTGDGYDTGFVEELVINLDKYVVWLGEQVASGSPDPYLFVLLGVGLLGGSLWIYDGMPVGREVFGAVRDATHAVARFIGQ